MRNPARRPSTLWPILLAVSGAVSIALGLAVGIGVTRTTVAGWVGLPEDAELREYADSPAAVAATDGAPSPSGDAPDEAGAPDRASGPDQAGDGAPAAPDDPPATARRALPKSTYVDVVLRRNIFDSTAVYNPAVASADLGSECRSNDSLRLVATVVADTPSYSSALIAIGSGRDAKLDGFAFGAPVGSDGRITLIEQNKVCLDGAGCICIGGEGKAPAADDDAPKGGDAEGIEKLSDTKFQVDKSVIDGAMGDLDKLAGQVRVSPKKDASGNIEGYRLSAIRRGSLLEKLGIKNGDVVHAVNGQPLTSTQGALATYQTLQNERAFTFEITRRNQRQTLEYEVR